MSVDSPVNTEARHSLDSGTMGLIAGKHPIGARFVLGRSARSNSRPRADGSDNKDKHGEPLVVAAFPRVPFLNLDQLSKLLQDLR